MLRRATRSRRRTPEPPHGRGALIASSPRSASWCAPEQLRRRPERRVAHTTLTCSAAPADAWMRRHGAPTSSGERRTVLRATSRPRRDAASGWARAASRHSDLVGRGRVRARPLHGRSEASQRHIWHRRCWGEARAAQEGRRRPVSGPVAPTSAQNLPPAAFDRLSATDCSRERPKWPSPRAERLGTLHIHTKCKLALIFGDLNCNALSV